MQNNLHITLTPFRNETRILKETSSLIRSGLVQHVYIAALHEDGLKEQEEIDNSRSVWRVCLKSRRWSRGIIVQLVKYIEFSARVILYARMPSPKI